MPPDPNDLLARSAAMYAACNTYRDQGVVTITYYGPDGGVERRPFSTRFARGRGFLFEFRSRHGVDDERDPNQGFDQHAVWLEGATTRRWSWETLEHPDKGLALALAALTGISGGSAVLVPSLLMPELHAQPPRPPTTTRIVENAEGTTNGCVVIERLYTHKEDDWTDQLWIDQKTLLIRRSVMPHRAMKPISASTVERLKAQNPAAAADLERTIAAMANRPPIETELVMTYEPACEVEIPPEELRFLLPAS